MDTKGVGQDPQTSISLRKRSPTPSCKLHRRCRIPCGKNCHPVMNNDESEKWLKFGGQISHICRLHMPTIKQQKLTAQCISQHFSFGHTQTDRVCINDRPSAELPALPNIQECNFKSYRLLQLPLLFLEGLRKSWATTEKQILTFLLTYAHSKNSSRFGRLCDPSHNMAALKFKAHKKGRSVHLPFM
jgi:hypothetical protein